jgi:hypothetical protein
MSPSRSPTADGNHEQAGSTHRALPAFSRARPALHLPM